MKTSKDPRHIKRQRVVQELFAWQANPKTKLEQEETDKIIASLAPIDQIIVDVAPEWGIDKINKIDLAILRLAVFELCLETETPPKVVIDEAIELAKEFGAQNSPVFINGALGKALSHKIRILKIIANKLGVEEEKLTREANLISDLNATTLEVTDLVSVLERDLTLSPPPNLSQINTVGNLLEYIEDHHD